MARTQHGLPGIYNSTPFTLLTGEGSALSVDANGQLLISGSGTGGGTAPGTSVIGGGVYNTSAPTYTNGQQTQNQSDVNGNLKVTLATLLAGENLTTNRLNVEPVYSYQLCTADVQVKAGAGTLHTVSFTCNDAAPTAGSVIIFDSLTETGTQILNHTFTTTPFAPCTVTLDASFATGLYVGFTTTNDVNVTVTYR